MRTLIAIVTRLLLLCAAVLMHPAIAAAQSTPLTVQRVWTRNASGNEKTTFAPGETVQFAADLNNPYNGSLLAANGTQLVITTGFYNNTKPIDIPPGKSTQTWNATAPSAESNYTVTVKAYDHFYGAWSQGSASFSVTAGAAGSVQSPQLSMPQHPPLPPAPGWYGSSGTSGGTGGSALIHKDSSGLGITWVDSYIYQRPGVSNLYWYAQVLYFNNGRQLVPITCSGRADPSLVKEWIRGTEGLAPGVSGHVPADETFCSRNPNFNISLNPGEAHFEWAIFHNVPPGGEISLEWQSYSSPWVDPWYSSHPPDQPLPAVCPPELVTLKTCTPVEQSSTLAGQLSQGVPPGFVCLGGRPGEQCNQPTHLIRQPIQWSNDPITIMRESPVGPVQIYKLLEQHNGLVCGMQLFLPEASAAYSGIALFADIFDNKLYMIPIDASDIITEGVPKLIPLTAQQDKILTLYAGGAYLVDLYQSCGQLLLKRQLFDPTKW